MAQMKGNGPENMPLTFKLINFGSYSRNGQWKWKLAKFRGKFWSFQPIWRPVRGRSRFKPGLKHSYDMVKGCLKARTVANGRDRSYFLSKFGSFTSKTAFFALWKLAIFPLHILKLLKVINVSMNPFHNGFAAFQHSFDKIISTNWLWTLRADFSPWLPRTAT